MIGRRRKPSCPKPADPNVPLIGRRLSAESVARLFELAKKCDGAFVRALAGGSCQVLFPAANRVLAFALAALAPEPEPPAFVAEPLFGPPPWNGFHQCPALLAEFPVEFALEVGCEPLLPLPPLACPPPLPPLACEPPPPPPPCDPPPPPPPCCAKAGAGANASTAANDIPSKLLKRIDLIAVDCWADCFILVPSAALTTLTDSCVTIILID